MLFSISGHGSKQSISKEMNSDRICIAELNCQACYATECNSSSDTSEYFNPSLADVTWPQPKMRK